MVTNLVVNGMDAQAGRGGGVIAVAIGPKDGVVSLEITDQGEGIRDDVLPRIFEPMFSTRSYGQHIGLGLGLARGMHRERVGGRSRSIQRVGVGTKVTVRLPKAE